MNQKKNIIIPDHILARLFLLEHPTENPSALPEKFKQIYRAIAPHVKSSDVPWGMILPEALLENYNKHLGIFEHTLQSLRDNSPYLNDVFIPTETALFAKDSIFQPAKIDLERYKQYLDEDPSKIVQSFEPGPDGFAQKPVYSRISTATGRLKVESGPNILNLKKQHRDMIVSRWGSDGAIIGLDYQALEPSLLIAFNKLRPAGSLTPPETDKRGYSTLGTSERIQGRIAYVDPYIQVMNLGGLGAAGAPGQMREIIKQITVSRMNGMQDGGLIQKIKTEIRDLAGAIHPEELLEKVDEVLCLNSVFDRLYADWTQRSNCRYIDNFYGRPFLCDSDTLLINRFFQSSAVDVAMLGFANIINYILCNIPDVPEFLGSTAVPLFLLHDMIIFDVNTAPGSSGLTTLNSFAKIGSNDLLGFEDGSFRLRQTPFIIPKHQRSKKT